MAKTSARATFAETAKHPVTAAKTFLQHQLKALLDPLDYGLSFILGKIAEFNLPLNYLHPQLVHLLK